MAKAKSTTAAGPVDKKKNAKGQSFKTVFPHYDSDGYSGTGETTSIARRMTKGMRPGTGKEKSNKNMPAPYAERNHRGTSHKHVPPRDPPAAGGSDKYYARVHSWVNGKRKSV